MGRRCATILESARLVPIKGYEQTVEQVESFGMVSRIFVEKKPGASPKAHQLTEELRSFLGITSLEAVRELIRYDAEGISKESLKQALTTVFSEPPVDNVYLETYPAQDGFAHPLIIQALPGQFDQRADSCAQCIQLLCGGERPRIASAEVFEFKGNLTADDLKKIEDYLLNPVESHVVDATKPETLEQKTDQPASVATIEGFQTMSSDELDELRATLGLAMDLADICFLQQYFTEEEKRDPTITEIRVVDTYWSDHCRHTTFSTHFDGVEIADPKVERAYQRYLARREELYGKEKAAVRPQTLMDIATLGTKLLKRDGKLPELDESDEINACSIHMNATVDSEEQDWLFMFKNETHNHPTEIEPFGGAATCIGGCIRDPLSGRAYVHQAMRITGAGDPRTPYEKTLPHKLPQKKIVTTAAEGYSSYGNQIGLATGFVHELYNEGYIAKHLECGAVVAAAPADHVKREAPEPGDVVVLLGGRTGRDGIGGATGSSKSHSKTSLNTMASEVQKGNAPEERKIQRLFRNKEVTRLIKRCNDFGAGGVSVAIGELAPGLEIDLDAVRKKYEGMDGTELAISESQERMACVVAASDVNKFCAVAASENLEAYPVASVTAEPRMKMVWNGQEIANLSRAFLDTNGADRQTNVLVERPAEEKETARTVETEKNTASVPQLLDLQCADAPKNPAADAPTDPTLKALMRSLVSASQRGLVERFDSTVGAGSLFMPYGGRYQRTPAQSMAALLPVMPGQETNQGSVMAYGCDLETLVRDPYQGAYNSVVDSIAKMVAAGANYKDVYLTLQEYFEKLGDEPTRWGKPFAALLGALDAQIDFEAAAIGGKDSMSGSFMELDVPPTLLSFAVAPVKTQELISNEFKEPNHTVYLYAPNENTEVANAYSNASNDNLDASRENPDTSSDNLDALNNSNSLKAAWSSFHKLAQEGKICAAYALDKTPAEAICNMSFGNRIGFSESSQYANWFNRIPGAIIIETSEPLEGDAFATLLGTTTAEQTIHLGGQTETIAALLEENESVLEEVYPTRAVQENPADRTSNCKRLADDKSPLENIPTISYMTATSPKHAAQSVASPRVAIPVFPGTNCEYDSARACLSAGLKPETVVIKNLTPQALEESTELFEKQLAQSQILFIPGGFSGGDEPDGSAKFIVSFLKHPRLQDAIHDLLDNRDGLILGICNGFQALIKLGLVPQGRIVDVKPGAPTLTFNQIGRHQSSIVHTRVASTKSPWMLKSKVGEVYEVPISHGEGRFVAPLDVLRSLEQNGQILTQYCTPDGHVSMEGAYNPNGSDWAIEGITSPDGRVLGKMGHAERIGTYLYKNVPGTYDLGLFASAKEYFS